MSPQLPTTGTRGTGAVAGKGFWPLRDLPALLWLFATVAAAVFHTAIPAPRWLMIHLLLLGAVSHSILVWSRHFADALLHTPARPRDRQRQSIRLALLNGGVVLVVGGVLAGQWWVTVAGATGVSLAALWHGGSLVAQLRAALPARFAMTVRFYVAAAALLPVGALLGTLMARGAEERTHQQILVAHVALNLLGWLGLTVLGTLVTLWPTMLRTRIAAGAERAASRALPILLAAVLITVGASLAGFLIATTVGVCLYLVGLAVLAVPFARAAHGKPPSSFATQSVLAGVLWLSGTLVLLATTLALCDTWAQAHERLTAVTPALATGFAAQVLLGAMSYLVPVALRGGPSAVRAANLEMDRAGPLRLVLVNAGLALSLLPTPDAVRTLGTVLALAGFASFLPLMITAIKASRRAKASGPAPKPPGRPRGAGNGLVVAGLAVALLAVAGGVAANPSALTRGAALSASGGVLATGHTTQVTVQAKGMRFSPDRIQVPAGDRLVITVRNADSDTVHDLVLDSGAHTSRLAPGAAALIDAGVVGREVQGWCSVSGHRQMGMVLQIVALGAPTPTAPSSSDGASPSLDFFKAPGPSFSAHNAQLPPTSASRIHRQTLTIDEVVREVSPGVTQRLWAYNGSVPGPVLHGKVGDVFDITLVNHASMGHSIDFHAGSVAPDKPMRTIPPGGSLTYTFTASRAGIWMYHCSTMPMSAHIVNGLFGAVIIDPPDLKPVNREYVLLQSELYLGPQAGTVDVDKLNAGRPDAVVFNGYVNQYDHAPLAARVGERVRIWVLDAGPNRGSAFHVVGGQFDTVYSEGAYLLRPGAGGSQTMALSAAQGGFVELRFPEAGHYPFITHVMVDAEHGAHGMFVVSP